MIERLTTITELPVDQVRVVARLREVTQVGVANMRDLIRRNGFLGRILVRRTQKGDFLLDGAHRLAAAQALGMTMIPCDIVRCNETEALALECDGNLGGRGLSPLELAYFMARKRDAYQKLYPETRQGFAGAAARHGADVFSSLAEAIAAERGITKRQVYRIMASGATLGPDEYRKLSLAPNSVKLDDLQNLAKIDNSAERYFVIDALAEGRAKKASAARRLFKADRGEVPPEKSDRTKAFDRLSDAWTRAGRLVQRSWLEANADEVRALLDEIDGAQE